MVVKNVSKLGRGTRNGWLRAQNARVINTILGVYTMRKLLALLLMATLVLGVAAPASAEWVRPTQTIETWDEEVDFVIVGFGLAGAAAAVCSPFCCNGCLSSGSAAARLFCLPLSCFVLQSPPAIPAGFARFGKFL